MNESLVLNLIRERQPVSRADLARTQHQFEGLDHLVDCQKPGRQAACLRSQVGRFHRRSKTPHAESQWESFDGYRSCGKYLGMGIAILVNELNPELIIVDGQISQAWEIIEPEIWRVLKTSALSPYCR